MTSAGDPAIPHAQVGTHVRVRRQTPESHCRTPRYLWGAVGEVEAIWGHSRNPASLAFHGTGLPPLILYRVRFRLSALWPRYAGGAADSIAADLFEHWLEPAESFHPGDFHREPR